MEDGMQTVTPGAGHLEATPNAYGTWQFAGDWESVDEQTAVASLVREGLTVRTTIRQEIMMAGQAIAPARETAARARENSEYVRSLLKVRQPQFAVALEAAVQKLLRDHGTVCLASAVARRAR
jgi:hypothetical protein